MAASMSLGGVGARGGSFVDAYIQVSAFHKTSFGANTSGFGRVGSGYAGVPPEFSWSNTFRQQNGPAVTSAFAGWDVRLTPNLAGWSVKNGTGIWLWNGAAITAETDLSVNGTFHWKPEAGEPNEQQTCIAFIHYIIEGRVGSHPGDKCEFTADVEFNFEGRHIPLHLHYLNTQPGATFSNVDLYAQAPITEFTINGNSSAEIDVIETTSFVVTDPGEGNMSGVGGAGSASSLGGATPTPPPVALHSAQPLNLSTRIGVLDGDKVLIAGFIVTGNVPKKAIIRGLGPSLQNFGVTGVLDNPTLELHDANKIIGSNDNWKETQQTEIENSGIAPTNELESAMIVTLAPGAYTALLQGVNHATGVGLIELYDFDASADSQLANLSARAFVQTGANVLIAGTIVGGSGNRDPARIMLRATGPSLQGLGIANPLPDPTLELHNGDGTLIETNNDWKDTQQAEIEATGLAPSSNLESVIISTLPVGNYTAVVADRNGQGGVGVIEAFNLP
jgi:hypothetical protein